MSSPQDDRDGPVEPFERIEPAGRSESAIVNFFVITNAEGTAIQPEGVLNLNAGLIMTTCFMFAWISGLARATTSIVPGTLFASAGSGSSRRRESGGMGSGS